MPDAEREEIRRLIGAEGDTVTAARKATLSLPNRPAEMERLTGRLQHLCRLIARDRRPYCPLNGVLVLIPFAATDSDQQATTTSTLCRSDLATARAALRVYCPVLALLCDLENAPGFREFVKRFPAEQRQRSRASVRPSGEREGNERWCENPDEIQEATDCQESAGRLRSGPAQDG